MIYLSILLTFIVASISFCPYMKDNKEGTSNTANGRGH